MKKLLIIIVIFSGLAAGGTEFTEFTENSEMGMDISDNLNRSLVKAGISALGAWGCASAGAAYGASFGSVVPIIGTVIGGVLGAWAGFVIGEEIIDEIFGEEVKFVGRRGPKAIHSRP